MTEAKNQAMALLARREHSRAELARKLDAKGYEAIEILSALDYLITQNYLSDTRFTACYIRFRIARGMGPVKILSELTYNHGIDKSAVLGSEAWLAVDWAAQAQEVYQRKYGESFSRLSVKPKVKAARLRFLQQRGFTIDQIQKAMRLLPA